MSYSKLTLLCLSLALSSLSYAGGVTCKQCPAESNACAPLPNCRADQAGSNFSETLHCIQAGLPKVEFTVEENRPSEGQALVTGKTGQSQILRFTQTVTRQETRRGPIESYHKNYFHPYFEYKLFATMDLDNSFDLVNAPTEYYGSYEAEQRQQAEVSCKVTSRKLNH